MLHKKIILNQTVGNIEHSLFSKNARDNASEPYFYLQNEFKKLGYDFCGVGKQNLDEVGCVIFWDSASFGGADLFGRAIRYLKQLRVRASTRNLISEVVAKNDLLKVLILFEPPSVDPGNMKKKNHELFDIIFTWNPTLIDNKKYFPIVLPSPMVFQAQNLTVPFQQKKLLVDVSGYKYTYHERSLSKFRMQEIRFFQQNYTNDFDLYGEGWNSSLKEYIKRKMRDWRLPREYFPSYRGTVLHKWDVLPKYKFSLCYENIADEPGFVSIKIFDCLRAGCVPIYRGAPDVDKYVDSKAFIDRRIFSTPFELGKYLSSMSETEYKSYVDAAKKYLGSERFQRFLSPSFSNDIIQTLCLFLKQEENKCS
ncbi:MAG: glycosyltransferase family 10 [Gammaproteobacteria bacterium]|nr:glycosyltransferase family 10 [Gammaproteobacteria bacterium]